MRAIGQKPVENIEGEALAKELDAFGYYECSALTQDNLKYVFDQAIRCVIMKEAEAQKKKNQFTCTIQ